MLGVVLCMYMGTWQGLGIQDMILCLQGVPGIKGDRGEPGQRGQDGIPVSPCPMDHMYARMWLLHILSYVQSWSQHCLDSLAPASGCTGSDGLGEKLRSGHKDSVALDLFSLGSTRRAWCGWA